MGTLASPPVAAGGGLGQRQVVFWKGTNKALYEAYGTPGNPSQWTGPKDLGYGQLGSTPCVIDANSTAYVFFKGANGDLTEVYGPDGGGPFTTVNLGFGGMKSSPTCAGGDGFQRQVVFWEGTNGDLEEAYWSPGRWVGPINVASGSSMASTPCVIDANSTAYVFWNGTNGGLYQSYGPDDGTGFTPPADLGMGPVKSAPTCAGGDGFQRQVVFFEGASGHLEEAYWGPGEWNGPKYVGISSVQWAQGVIDTDSTAFVFYHGTNGHLWEAYGPNGGGPL